MSGYTAIDDSHGHKGDHEGHDHNDHDHKGGNHEDNTQR
jgi:hypothetical protein